MEFLGAEVLVSGDPHLPPQAPQYRRVVRRTRNGNVYIEQD